MGLRNSDYEAVKMRLKRVFRDNWKGMFTNYTNRKWPRMENSTVRLFKTG